jgi:hypothetical protein
MTQAMARLDLGAEEAVHCPRLRAEGLGVGETLGKFILDLPVGQSTLSQANPFLGDDLTAIG